MEHSSRHLRFKLQSLSRRLDDLEEATKNLQKAEDEVLDLQDKIIQAEGSNSSMLAEVEALRKRVLKIEGKDEEVKKAEDLCRLIKEKLENEENITRELKLEIEQLQKRMGELEKLEEAFNKSKNDCTQLSLSLNEEKNMSKKLTSELEILKTRVKELESSESKLDKAEQFLTSELEKIRSLSLSFANEKKQLLEREKQNEKLILELKEQLELKGKMTGELSRNESNAFERSPDQHVEHNKFRIEDSLTSKSSPRVGFDYIKQSDIQTSSNNENEKNKYQEDNKIKELNQEIEKLKNQLKLYEGLEQELKQLKEKHSELQESYISEQNKNKLVTEELQILQRKTNQNKEVENGILESEELSSRSKIKNERKSKVASTDNPISKYSSQDSSSQQLKNDRFRNSELRRQLSNSSSSSKKSSRSTLLDTTGNLKKEEKVGVSYFSSGKDFSISHNDAKKSKDQPSVLSRYPPAGQEQAPQRSWKGSTSKQTDRSMRFFGEDYSVKAYSKKEISLENEEIEKGIPGDTSENKVHTEETMTTENRLSPLHRASSNLGRELDNAQANTDVIFESKLQLNTGDLERKSSSQDRLSRYGGILGREDSATNSFDEQNLKSSISNHQETDPQTSQTSSSQRSYYSRDRTKGRASKPQIPEKPHILEMSDHRDPDRRTRLSGLHTKRQSSSRERVFSLDSTRHSSFENHSYSSHKETGSFRKISSDGLDSTETNSHISTSPRSCSPREALQSTVVIKPIIIERDVKEIMSDYRARSSSDVNRTPNKVSSIKIYPSETSSRTNTDEITRERHTSTSNIRLSANDQPMLKNNISIPLEISLNKDDLILKVADKDFSSNSREASKNLDQINKRDKVKENDLSIETVPWKSHDIGGTNHFDSKRVTNKSSWRKSGFGSTEELDRLSNEKDDADSKSRRKSCFDGENPSRLRSSELHSRNKVSSINSYSTTSDYISKRSQSSLSATEIIARRNTPNISLTSGRGSWTHSSFEVDDNFNSRRKYSSENLYRTDSTGWKQSTSTNQRHQRSMVEERIRQLEH